MKQLTKIIRTLFYIFFSYLFIACILFVITLNDPSIFIFIMTIVTPIYLILGTIITVFCDKVDRSYKLKINKSSNKNHLDVAFAHGFNIHTEKKQCGYCLKHIMLKSVVCPYCEHLFTRNEIELDVIQATQRFMMVSKNQ